MVLLCFLTMGTRMVEKQPSCFLEVAAQQSIIRKKGSFGSSVLLPAVAWQLCRTDVAMKVLERSSLSAAFYAEPGPVLIKERFF